MLQQLHYLFALSCLCAAFCIIIIFMISVHLCGYDLCLIYTGESNKPIKPVQYLSIFSILSFIICLLSQLYIITSTDNQYEFQDNSIPLIVIISTNIISWTFGQLFLYLLFIANLYYTFINTSLELSKLTFIILFIMVSIFALSRLAYIAYYIFYYFYIVSTDNFSFFAVFIVSFTELIDLILSIMLVYIFVNRLFKLFVMNKEQKSLLIIQESKSTFSTAKPTCTEENIGSISYNNVPDEDMLLHIMILIQQHMNRYRVLILNKNPYYILHQNIQSYLVLLLYQHNCF